MKKRNIIIGIDGVPFELIKSLSNKGIMPNISELIQNYSFLPLKSSIPHVSSVSWSSIITGKNPGEHGIYGFMELIENTYSLKFPNFYALKCKPFWHEHPQKRHVIINVPATYPARELNGIHIAGFVALDLEKAIYPKSLIMQLKNLNYEIDVDTKLAHQQSIDALIDDLFRLLEIRKRTYELFWDKNKWDNFMFVITGSDRLGHFLWNIYEEKDNKYHNRFLDYFREIDNIIGDIYSKLNENDTLIILSDHGMEGIKQKVNLNSFLENEGYLKLGSKLKRYNRITNDTKAFVLDPGRVYLNKKSIYPRGSVEKEDEKDLIEELKTVFQNLKFKDQNIIKTVYKKEEIYSGKMIDSAPDLVLIENKGFQIGASIGKKNLFEKVDVFSGKHNERAFLLTNKEMLSKEPSVVDIVNLMNF